MPKRSAKKSSKAIKGKASKKKSKSTKKGAKTCSKSSTSKSCDKSSTKQKAAKVTVKALITQIQANDLLVTKKSKYIKSMDGVAYSHCRLGKNLKKLARLLGVSYRTIIYWRERSFTFSDSIKRGYADWLLELPDKLVKHMEQGLSYTAFAGDISRSKEFLYALERAWPEFKEAKDIGLPKSQAMWESLGMRQITGQLTTNLGEVPLMGNGQVIKDDNGKNILVDKIVPAKFSDRAFVFMLGNRFEDYKPKADTSNDEILDDLREAIAEVNGEVLDGQQVEDDTQDIE